MPSLGLSHSSILKPCCVPGPHKKVSRRVKISFLREPTPGKLGQVRKGLLKDSEVRAEETPGMG